MRTLLCLAPLLFGCALSLSASTEAERPAPLAVGPSSPSFAPSLLVPVAGVLPYQVPDTYYAPRAGGRLHEATDILAPLGTEVLSADDGSIVRVGDNRLGGNIIYAVDPSGRYVYYYAHLLAFAPGLTAGQAIRRGDVLGYVGQSGNAGGTAPHLHFQMMLRPENGSFYGGPPVDPRPFFTSGEKAVASRF